MSGNCNEDCAFCTQSIKYNADINRYRYKSIEQIVDEAKRAKENGAIGYCLVTAGKGLDEKKTKFIAKAARAIKKEINGFNLIACNGIATKEQLKFLKESGIDSYNHNLESSKEYYSKICTTHSWEERFETILNAKEVGLKVCSGGIFGMGESKKDREALIESLKKLNPDSVPINFFIPNPKLPLKERNIDFNEALEVIKRVKEALPNARIMVAGGREQIFDSEEKELLMYKAGARAIVIGDYLTVKGREVELDKDRLKRLGLKVARNCNGN